MKCKHDDCWVYGSCFHASEHDISDCYLRGVGCNNSSKGNPYPCQLKCSDCAIGPYDINEVDPCVGCFCVETLDTLDSEKIKNTVEVSQ